MIYILEYAYFDGVKSWLILFEPGQVKVINKAVIWNVNRKGSR